MSGTSDTTDNIYCPCLHYCFYFCIIFVLQNMVLHYLSDGVIMISINYRKEIFFVPLVFIFKASTDNGKLNPRQLGILKYKSVNALFSNLSEHAVECVP